MHMIREIRGIVLYRIDDIRTFAIYITIENIIGKKIFSRVAILVSPHGI